jgi:ribonuclease J
MKLLLQLVRPRHFIPIHGELRHLRLHASLARQVGLDGDRIAVIENGMPIEFVNGRMRIGERIPGGYVFVDGTGVGDIGPAVMREREALGRDGFVVAHLDLDPHTGGLRHEPEILSKGFVFVRDAEELFERARGRIRQVASQGNGDSVRARVEKDLEKFFYTETHRRPMVFVFTNDSR